MTTIQATMVTPEALDVDEAARTVGTGAATGEAGRTAAVEVGTSSKSVRVKAARRASEPRRESRTAYAAIKALMKLIVLSCRYEAGNFLFVALPYDWPGGKSCHPQVFGSY
jgi:hypothetical protein